MGLDSSRRVATWGGIPLKHLSLITLTLQNSAQILIMHYSRIMPLVDGRRYFASTAVLLNEVIKFAFSLTMALHDVSGKLEPSTPATTMFVALWNSTFSSDSWRLAIPAVLYTFQNTLQYIAVSNLDAATFQVTYQLKILTTAIFSISMLGRSLSGRKWASLILLMLGVAIVQFPAGTGDPLVVTLKTGYSRYHFPRSFNLLQQLGNEAVAQLTKRSATYEGIKEDFAMQHAQPNRSIGFAAVVVACVLSGFAGVYFEMVLKDANANISVWMRNLQLSFYSLFPAFFIGVLLKDGEQIAKEGFFTGYNWVVWTTIAFQAVGGIVVALVVNYADNIAKNFATSISIVISCLASVYFFDFSITSTFVVGTAVVLLATYLYNGSNRAPAMPVKLAEYEKTTIAGNPSYFDSRASTLQPSSMRNQALTTSRPGTPGLEGRHVRPVSERRSGKRDD